ncbi:MAG TPA: fibronectin type III domain-containing protein, partial [Bacteroidia bacterium]|nr:fibronectin type III domain-containing protein [Bacteroidia bacterium]
MANSYSKKANRPLSWAVAILILFALPVNSQVITDYAFNANAGNYATLTGATAPPLTAGSLDDGYYNNLPLGFSFCYNGQTYTSFHTSTNGWGSFLPLTANTLGNNLTTGGTPRPVIAPLWDDLEVNPAGEFRYMTTGSAGSQVFTAEWFLMQWNFTAATPVISFQVKIYEGTNVIEFVYRPEAGANTNPSASVGITATGVGSGNFLSVDSLTTTAIVSSTTETTTIGNMPSAGLLFTFTPPAPPASPINLTFTAVTASGMTLNWEDNSTNENTFTVWRSLDNVNYTQVTTITSTTQATTGNPYSYVATGLFTNTLYYWRVFAVNAGCSNAPLTGQQSTLSGTLCGTFTVGPTGAYTSLTAAIADVQANGVQCPLIFELQAAYVCTVETFPLVVPFLGTGPTTSITVRPEMGADSLIISSSAIVTIDMSGATYFVFDGRPGGVGTAIELTIADSSTTGIAARFINDAQNSGYMFCKIRGNNTATTSGVIVFSTALTAGANSNNSITDCEIFDFISTPVNLVYASNATAATFNSGNIFSNNLFHDWYLGTAANMAMNIAAGNTGWTITNNSFYQTATRNYTTGTTHVVINANSGSATATGNFTINGNSIGGTAPGAGGTPWTITGAVISRFIGIQTNTGTGGTNNIQGNTITNFNFSSSSTTATANGIWCGINMIGTSGSNNTGTVTPNIIGSTATDSAIVTTTTGTGGLTIGINSSASGANVISNNQIGGFTALSGSATTSTNIMGIQTTAGNVTISGNVIGSTGVANSMMNAPSTGTTAGQVTGIVSTVTVSSSITGNTIVNLTNRYAGTSTIGQTRGIATTSSTNTINGNIISNLASTSGVVSATSPVVVGIAQTSTTANANQTISNNTITNLASSSASTNVSMVGIYYNGPATGTNRIFNNNISGIGAPLNIGNPVISGIYVNAGVSRFYNNMILLGVDASGNPITQAHEYNGIIKVTTANNNFFYNTVHIDGSGVFSGTANTYSFRRTSATGTDSLYNNVLTNFRSNASGGGAHYSLGMANTTTFASDYNNFFGTGSGYSHAIVGTTVYPTLASWTAALSLDQLSYSVSPDYISATDLHINNTSPSLLESRALAISGITFDIDNDVRPGPVGSVNGGGVAPDIGADEFDGIPVQVDVGVQTLLLPLTTGCHGASDTVRVRVLNFTPFAVNMSADPLMIVSYTQGANPQSFPNLVISSGTIPAGGTLDTIVSTTYNMTAAGIHTFFAYTNVTADVVNSNDSLQPVSILISGGTYVAPNNGEICIGSPTTLNVTGFTNGGTVQWEESPDNVTWTPIAGATTASFSLTPSDTTFYRAVICGIHNSSVDTVFPELVPPAITTDTIRCGPGPVTLTASGTGFLNWYDQPSGGSLVNTGPTFSSSVINTDTFYVENASDPPAILTTTFAGGNSFFGNMFAVTALSNITITSFDGNVDATADYEIWYMQNDYNTVAGATSSNAAWTFIGNATGVPSNGTGIATPIPIPVNITIPAGQTYSFYITILAGTMNYTNGTVLGNVFASNADLQFREGHGGAYFNLVNSPRVWNGNIHYLSGCISATRTPLIVEVTPSPIISTTAADSIVCDGGSTVLSVSSPNPDYSFTWSPAANLSTTTGSSTVFTPTTPGTYTYFIDANDTATACLNRDTIVVEMELNPTVIASVSNDSICPGTSVNLNAVANLRVYKPDTANTANTTMTYPAPYGNWFWGAKHQML